MGRCGLGGRAGRCKCSSAGPSSPPSSSACPHPPGLFCLRCYALVSRITLVPDSISQGISGKRFHRGFSSSPSKVASVPLYTQPHWSVHPSREQKTPTSCPGSLPLYSGFMGSSIFPGLAPGLPCPTPHLSTWHWTRPRCCHNRYPHHRASGWGYTGCSHI